MSVRQCSKPSCTDSAAATLTYVYADSMVVVGQLATEAEPHSYDLCARHAERFTAPRGWDIVRIQQEFVDPGPNVDDIDALARAVREAGANRITARGGATVLPENPLADVRKGHLRVIGEQQQ